MLNLSAAKDFLEVARLLAIRLAADRLHVALHLRQIGFVHDHFSHPSLETVSKWRQPLLAMVHPDHPLAGRSGLTLPDLVDMPCVLPDDGFGIAHKV
ncbi:LysR family transcriptional regulator substrate-binding protein [Hoeflea halophila]|uniref:LysR family transcriptional regulator substrate-binding protein n=1 Tax=Hoeflea halophila TaxID=714899 RepID=UPI000BE3A932|nr:LysR family transcriptional regulator substrate-binding protein [Hoeflea halophila]